MNHLTWTRRRLLQGIGAVAVAQHLADPLGLAAASPAGNPHDGAQPAIAPGARLYAHLPATPGSAAGLGVFTYAAAGWQRRQFLPAPQLRALHAHGSEPVLYAACSALPHPGATAGHMDLYRIDPRTGLLQHHVQQPCALAARTPAAVALSPDGSLLVVADRHGIFSILPVAPDGNLHEVTAVRKELRSQIGTGDATQTGTQAATPALQFLHPDLLLVHSHEQTRAYHCTRDGMHPVPTPVNTRDLQAASAQPPLLPGALSCILRT